MKINFEYTVQLEKEIEKALLEKISKVFLSKKDRIKELLSERTRAIFTSTEEYNSLTEGELMAHFGLPKGKAKFIVDSIISAFSEEVEIDVQDNALIIYSIKSDFADILSMNVSSYISTNSKGISTEVPWLRWFLLEGDRIVVEDFHIDISEKYFNNRYSRSKKALMLPGGSWKPPVNPKYSGVIKDNWITSAVFLFRKEYQKILGDIMKEVLNV